MKNLFTIFPFLFATLLIGCQKDEKDSSLTTCTGDCLFTLHNATGTVVKMDCFGKYGIKTTNPTDSESEFIYGIPDAIGSQYEVVGKVVHFSAAFRHNSLPLQFPDPSVDMDAIYQIKLTSIGE